MCATILVALTRSSSNLDYQDQTDGLRIENSPVVVWDSVANCTCLTTYSVLAAQSLFGAKRCQNSVNAPHCFHRRAICRWLMWVHQSGRPEANRGHDVTVIQNLREAATERASIVNLRHRRGAVDEH